MAQKMTPTSSTPTTGVNTQQIDRAASLPTNDQGTLIYPINLGTTVTDEDDGVSIYAAAQGSIPGGTLNCTLSGGQGNKTATAGGGNYASPAIIMNTGDAGWFSRFLV